MMQSIMASPITWWVVVGALGYVVGRIGVPTLYQDIKHFVQGVKSSVSSATTTTPAKSA